MCCSGSSLPPYLQPKPSYGDHSWVEGEAAIIVTDRLADALRFSTRAAEQCTIGTSWC